jgi:uncharacterized membrane protein YeaQ/YmgE (transglycosylase-associated protein family)
VSLLVFIAALLASGLLVGALGRLALPGPDPMGLLATIGVGVAGSLAGGLIVGAIAGPDAYGWGLPVAVLCATGIVYLVRRRRGGSFTRPAPRKPGDDG